MKITSNTLQLLVETWEDPGDYPNSIASGPLPSYKYIAGIEGEVHAELTPEEETELVQLFVETQGSVITEWFEEHGLSLPDGVLSSTAKWDIKFNIGSIIAEVSEVEADPDYESESDCYED